MAIYLTTEATADFPQSMLKENCAIIPMGYTVNGTAYDGETTKLSPSEFYNACRQATCKEDLPQTTMVTAYAAECFFRPILQAGHDILHIGFSSALSGTCDQIRAAAQTLREEFPDRRIEVVDSLSACFVEGLLYYYVLQKRDSGANMDELVAYTENMRLQCNGYFIVDDLKHLMRTGRTSRAAAFIGGALQIKPMLYINNEGKLVPIAKAMSRKKAVRTLLNKVSERAFPLDSQQLIAVGHADCESDAMALADVLRTEYHAPNVMVFDIGPVIGTHVGAGMLAIILLAPDRNDPADPSNKA